MAFYWRRRRKPWYGFRFKRRYRKRKWPRRRRRFRSYTRRRTRRSTRRRRKPKKVRRKRQTIPVRQWQPDSVVNCHIKGFGTLVLGAEGCQYKCYTNEKTKWVRAKAPGGGGFGVEQYTLGYLYQENIFKQNIWTKTNIARELCRYIRVRFTFYRHNDIDFIINYSRMPPFQLNKYTYMTFHPMQMLLSKHKIILLSKNTKPNGRLKKTKVIRPPKLMITKWFFQDQFYKQPLLQLAAAAASIPYSRIGCCTPNQIITIFFLNPGFYKAPSWMNSSTPYKPYSTIQEPLTFTYPKGNTTATYTKPTTKSYDDSVAYEGGWFDYRILQAFEVKYNGQTYATIPVRAARYNPNLDNGKNNKVWVVSCLTSSYNPPKDENLVFENIPLWLAFYGIVNYIEKVKNDKTFLNSHMFIVQSPAIEPWADIGTQNYYPFIDRSMLLGKLPYDETLKNSDKIRWYPSYLKQVETINAFVKTGPYITKLEYQKNSTWELDYKYDFFFKWGGAQLPDTTVADPATQGHFDTPSTFQETVQIADPAKQVPSAILHTWDYRRGLIKEKALRRMCENLETETDIQTDATGSPPAKRKRLLPELQCPQEENQEIQKCLQELFKESISKEAQKEEDVISLINQQREKQQQLKFQLLQLIDHLKDKQRQLQLYTGLIN
nr:MAG: ORF1 [Torque teno midi virus]